MGWKEKREKERRNERIRCDNAKAAQEEKLKRVRDYYAEHKCPFADHNCILEKCNGWGEQIVDMGIHFDRPFIVCTAGCHANNDYRIR